MKRDLAGNPFNTFWCVVNVRGEVWPNTMSYVRIRARERFEAHTGEKWGKKHRKEGFRLVRVKVREL